MDIPIPGLIALTGLVAVHLGAVLFRLSARGPRSVWLSIAGGSSVAYVFLALLPELGEGQGVVGAALGPLTGQLDTHIYIIALAGLTFFFGFERLATNSRAVQRAAGQADRPTTIVFWIHLASFATVNLLIGYLLHERDQGSLLGLGLYAVAMSFHLLVIDAGLREHYRETYDGIGRWLLAASLAVGWVIGLAGHIDRFGIAVMSGFLGGGMILQVLKDELPEANQTPFWAFLAGAAGYGLVLVFL
jgi:hypothetical protein